MLASVLLRGARDGGGGECRDGTFAFGDRSSVAAPPVPIMAKTLSSHKQRPAGDDMALPENTGDAMRCGWDTKQAVVAMAMGPNGQR